MYNKKLAMATLMASSLLCAGLASAQSTATQPKPAAPAPGAPVAGMTPLGVTVVQMEAIIAGWSVQKDILKKAVTNDKNEKIGTVADIIISPSPDAKSPAATVAIIGVGGFLGMGKHDVAIPMEQFRLQENKLVLPGATKDALKALPAFEYRRK